MSAEHGRFLLPEVQRIEEKSTVLVEKVIVYSVAAKSLVRSEWCCHSGLTGSPL